MPDDLSMPNFSLLILLYILFTFTSFAVLKNCSYQIHKDAQERFRKIRKCLSEQWIGYVLCIIAHLSEKQLFLIFLKLNWLNSDLAGQKLCNIDVLSPHLIIHDRIWRLFVCLNVRYIFVIYEFVKIVLIHLPCMCSLSDVQAIEKR